MKLKVGVCVNDSCLSDQISNYYILNKNRLKYSLEFIVDNGKDCLDKIEDEKIHVLIVEGTIPLISGLDLVREIENKNFRDRPKIIMVADSKYTCNEIYNEKIEVDRFILKPVNINFLSKAVSALGEAKLNPFHDALFEEDLFKVIHQRDSMEIKYLESKIMALLIDMGFPSDMVGFYYLKLAILFVCLDTNLSTVINKSLFYFVGINCKKNSKTIEASIRSVIRETWNRKSIKNGLILGRPIKSNDGIPTSKELISIVSDYIILERDK